MNPIHGLSIVVPLAPGENGWINLLQDPQLKILSQDILFSSTEPEPANFKSLAHAMPGVRWIVGPIGRARQLNFGALQAKGPHILFLHADSRLDSNALNVISRAIASNKKCIYFFRLKFSDSLRLMKINEFGVWLRSEVLKLPFGDQGFLMAKETFERLGRFNEKAPYGEDHLLIWNAHQQRIDVVPLKCAIFTSARKYLKYGWLKTTLRHVQLTAIQAAPEVKKYLDLRFNRNEK